MKATILYVAIFLSGLLSGVVWERGALWPPKTEWDKFQANHEAAAGERIVQLQKKATEEATNTALDGRIKIQTGIEELIVKSRAAEHSKWAVFGTEVVGVFGFLFGGAVTFMTAKLHKR